MHVGELFHGRRVASGSISEACESFGEDALDRNLLTKENSEIGVVRRHLHVRPGAGLDRSREVGLTGAKDLGLVVLPPRPEARLKSSTSDMTFHKGQEEGAATAKSSAQA